MKTPTVALLVALAASSILAADKAAPAASAAAAEKAELERSRQHHAALADKQRDIEVLKAEVRKWRAQTEMCRAGIEQKTAKSAGK